MAKTIAQGRFRNKPRVAVALSGGVDSAVSAALLQQQGYAVVGFYMKNWSDETECPWVDDYEDVKRICHVLNIPYYTVNFENEYREQVLAYFLKDYAAGETPNPDVVCNSTIKFKAFFEYVRSLNFDYLVTGHYARIRNNMLYRGADKNKDQSYFIFQLSADQLRQVMFPLGQYTKTQVRRLATQFNLPVASKPDSQGLCFIGHIDFRSFLRRYLPVTPGPMCLVDGTVVGQHDGLAFYTVGQRSGIGLGGNGPYYVVAKERASNTLILCRGQNDPHLYASQFSVRELHWIDPDSISIPFQCLVQIRYRSQPIPATFDGTTVHLAYPARAVTPGQFAVFYDQDKVLGGGTIR